MSKKMNIITWIILGILSITYFGQKIYVHRRFESYVAEKYPERNFRVHRVTNSLHMNFPNSIYPNLREVAKVDCISDGTEFTVSRKFNNDKIIDNYLSNMHDVQWKREFNTLFEYQMFLEYIEKINVLMIDKEEVFNTNEAIKYNKLPQVINVYFHEDKIEDNQHRGEIIYEIIKVLKNNEINVIGLSSYFSKDGGEYCLDLKNDDMNKNAEEIAALVIRKK